ncbi:hypothetical protein O3M35_011190 [Rhynocoris fuscipes]|uniref:C2H2-type domain-containing protein n=1 Tax=Rhynocoris fuscipes TaxID=488301 RepID=A0AAW1CU67_9HEMI
MGIQTRQTNRLYEIIFYLHGFLLPTYLCIFRTRRRECDQCGKTFCDSKALKKHVKAVHAKLKPYSCQVCGHCSATKNMLRVHLRQHSGDKPFACPACSYSTGDHNSLRRHWMRHTGVRPYSCPHCPYSAIQSCSLKSHLLRQHPGLPGIYSCYQCSFVSVSKNSLDDHLRTHNTSQYFHNYY